ncbi:MAG TPA: thioredoxin, partial [Anaeromyxobacter sp.]
PASASRPDAPRAIRSGPPPVYRPSAAAAPPTAGRAPLLRRDTVGTFENRLRWSARWRWLAPLLVLVAAAGGVAGWFLLSRRGDPEASRTRTDAMSLVALDDAASVEQAITRLDAILRRTPKHRGAVSDRALAYVLRAATLVEEGETLAAHLAARTAERDRLRRDQPDGWEDAERAAAADAQKLAAEVKGREERARALGGAAFQVLRRLQSEQVDAPDVARALAAYYALGADRDRARKTIQAAREKAPADPWLDLVEAWVDARDPDHAARQRALVQLGALSVAHPELLRSRYLLARTQAALGRRAEAIATLDALLAVNGRHEAGKRLRDELTAASAPVPPAPPPPAKPAPQPRKLVTHRVPAPAPVPAAALPSELEPGASERSDARPAQEANAPAPAPPPPAAGTPAATSNPQQGPAATEPPSQKVEPRHDREPRRFLDGG